MDLENTVACPQCGTKNRLHQAANGEFPICGNCKTPLPWIAAATDATFQNEVAASLVLVDFWAAWCAPCKIVSPTLEQLARDQAGKLKLVKVDVDKNPATAAQFNVRSIPTMIMLMCGAARPMIPITMSVITVTAMTGPAILIPMTRTCEES